MKQTISSESGLVSILVTMIIMTIIGLITIGFVRIIGREQRQALDRQLSTQAYYAAESGINDAINALNNGYRKNKTDCEPDPSDTANFPPGANVLNAEDDVSYTCLLINQTPTSLVYNSIDTSKSTLVPISICSDSSACTAKISRINISWHDENGSTNFTNTYPSFPQTSAWTSNTGVLRVSLTPTTPGVAMDRNSLVNNTFTTFLYPQANGSAGSVGSVTYATGPENQGPVADGRCHRDNLPRYCSVDVVFPAAYQYPDYFLQMRSFYSNSSVTVRVFQAGSGNQHQIFGAQSIVDSTGKARDVLRRIQARVPTRNTYDYPSFALESMNSLCKRLGVMPTTSDGTNISQADTAFDPSCAVE